MSQQPGETSTYNGPVKKLLAVIIFGFSLTPASAVQTKGSVDVSELNTILDRMNAHEEWQKRNLVEYQVHRKFYAANPRFKQESVLEVKTIFKQPATLESEVVRSEGSQLIRTRVFDKILEAEKEANQTKQEVTITPVNYNFTLLGKQDCTGRPCYHLRITPKRKNKYSINGQIWVDAEDGALVRLEGSPAQRPSFWTLSTKVERRYERIEGVWLCVDMESSSDIFIAGQSTLKVEYDYSVVQTAGA
jgi:outer membrane lipoprotein-sorting protein